MILTDYYKFAKLPGGKSKMRMDCVASTKSYDGFEALRNKKGELFVYVGDNTYTQAGERGKSDMALSRGVHITSLCTTDIALPCWYGDFKNTSDAMMMIHTGFDRYDGAIAEGSTIEVFIARGQRSNRHNLFTEFVDGERNDEIEALRQRAISELPDGDDDKVLY